MILQIVGQVDHQKNAWIHYKMTINLQFFLSPDYFL